MNPRRTTAYRRARKIVISREESCWICGGLVDKKLPSRLPLSPEVDHKIPLALGGDAFDLNNLGLTHKICNQIKGDKTIGHVDADMMAKHFAYKNNFEKIEKSGIDWFEEEMMEETNDTEENDDA